VVSKYNGLVIECAEIKRRKGKDLAFHQKEMDTMEENRSTREENSSLEE